MTTISGSTPLATISRAILATIGVLDDAGATGSTAFHRRDGGTASVARPAVVVADNLPAPDDDLVIQVSRWDRLKDMPGVLHGFADHVAYLWQLVTRA